MIMNAEVQLTTVQKDQPKIVMVHLPTSVVVMILILILTFHDTDLIRDTTLILTCLQSGSKLTSDMTPIPVQIFHQLDHVAIPTVIFYQRQLERGPDSGMILIPICLLPGTN